MIYNIAAKVLYANGYLQLAEYSFKKSKHLTEEDKLSMAILYIKLFQRYLDNRYINNAIQLLVELRITFQEAAVLLERINQSEELKEYVEVLLSNLQPYAYGEYDPLVYLIYDYFRSKGKIIEKEIIKNVINTIIDDNIEDNIMKVQALIFAIENEIPYTPELANTIIDMSYFPLGYNPLLLPKSIRSKFLEIFFLDRKIIELRKLINKTHLPSIQRKIDENKNKLIDYIKDTYLTLLAFYTNEQAMMLIKLVIYSCMSLHKDEKNKLYEELNF